MLHSNNLSNSLTGPVFQTFRAIQKDTRASSGKNLGDASRVPRFVTSNYFFFAAFLAGFFLAAFLVAITILPLS